ncbi:N-acetylglucosaminyldiphosphoundecaprenol N-acetyl-beta-D-mannosaminyltransferase [Scopulibacillus daqui]|uniref:N-acetylglucosaminyldiphosphoundecaprenol N-acetyl-beta-D-mannosaminyltransferase n=1 Tax=Scopulibacillus daqui TaxID=1469162 RepID=A0ABS2PYJ1_9BACL|nr:WecB/TagA/CpsF family glycosyltransferase [Scopulibacillus daqui]MBM7644931.1 N-acetylglucosaminyldiphosphoundecaprenol N-acetyl-beta-D-mannosaminyltransferase [Scopulibacillus daqui]
MRTTEVMDYHFINSDIHSFVQDLNDRLANRIKTFIITANPEIIMYAGQDSQYREIIHEADYIAPDGAGVVIASRILGTPLMERITGFDLMQELLKSAEEKSYSVYFLGAEPEIIKQAVSKIQKDFPRLNIAGYHHGYIHDDKPIVNEIRQKQPDIVFVGLGFPKQEQWIHQHLKDFNHGLFMGVGGSYDVIAGKLKRAPKIWQKFNLEWLYRLCQQPSRWRRMSVLPIFMLKAIKKKFIR